MMQRRTTQLAVAGAIAAAAVFAAPAAQAHGGFSLSIGLPGFAVGVGAPYYAAPYYAAPYYAAPAPAAVYVAPPVVYAPPRVVYYGPRVVYRAPYRGHVVGRPVYYHYH